MSTALLEAPEKGAPETVETPGKQHETEHATAVDKTARAHTTADIETQLKNLLSGEPEAQPTKTGDEPPPETEPGAESTEEEQAAAADKDKAQWPESAQRRVDKLIAQRHELKAAGEAAQAELATHQARVTELETQLQKTLDGAAAQATAGEPLGFITTAQKLSEYQTKVKSHARAMEDYLDGALSGEALEKFTTFAREQGAVGEDGEIIPAKIKQVRRLAQDTLEDLIPHRLAYLQQETAHSDAAAKKWPWLADKNSPESKRFDAVIAALPEVKKMPHWKVVGAIYVKGLMAQEAEDAAAAKTAGKAPAKPAAKPTPAPPRMPGTATALPTRTGDSSTNIQALREKASRTQSPKDFEALVRAQLDEAID